MPGSRPASAAFWPRWGNSEDPDDLKWFGLTGGERTISQRHLVLVRMQVGAVEVPGLIKLFPVADGDSAAIATLDEALGFERPQRPVYIYRGGTRAISYLLLNHRQLISGRRPIRRI
jgi:hypothetical protein